MKKVLFLLAVAVFFLQAPGFAQKSRVGITAGITTANMYGHVGGKDLRDAGKTGITAGLILETPICKSRWSFQPGLHYTQKGRILTETSDVKSWLALRYADLHLNFLYNSKGKTTFFIGGGPTLGMDLPSYKRTKTSNATASNLNPDPEFSISETKIKFGKDKLDDLRGLDYGVNIMIGFRMRKGYYFAINNTFGLRNIAPNNGTDDRIRNGCLGFRIGYLFNNK